MKTKLPQLTAAFWIMKIAATTLGETAGDLVSMTLKVGYALSSITLLSAFMISLFLQIWSSKYRPSLYWIVILTTSTAGTTISDYMDRTLGLGYASGAAILISILTVVLVIWRFTTGSLSIYHINTRGAEVFYWIAILFSNTLGTALGDFLADSSGLGFVGGAAIIGGLLSVILCITYTTNISRVGLFWVAFVLSRPFGATIGDLLTKPTSMGGLNLGTIGSSIVLVSILAVGIFIAELKSLKLIVIQPL
jgi:uncharacterized membrane-anchored protein